MPTVIEFGNVTKIFQHRFTALSGVSFQVEAGEVCAFLGPNGAGKTTSIGILMGFLFPDHGEIRVLGLPPGDVRAKEKIGFLPENFAFYKHLTARELLRLHLALSGRRTVGDDLIAGLLARVKLNGCEDRKISRYSRGMVQRLALARALLTRPSLLLLDEPFTGHDRDGALALGEQLGALRDAGAIVVVVTHDLEAIANRTDHVAILRRGQLVFEERGAYTYDQLKDVYHRHAN